MSVAEPPLLDEFYACFIQTLKKALVLVYVFKPLHNLCFLYWFQPSCFLIKPVLSIGRQGVRILPGKGKGCLEISVSSVRLGSLLIQSQSFSFGSLVSTKPLNVSRTCDDQDRHGILSKVEFIWLVLSPFNKVVLPHGHKACSQSAAGLAKPLEWLFSGLLSG